MTHKHPLRDIVPRLRRKRLLGCLVVGLLLLGATGIMLELMFGLISVFLYGSGWS